MAAMVFGVMVEIKERKGGMMSSTIIVMFSCGLWFFIAAFAKSMEEKEGLPDSTPSSVAWAVVGFFLLMVLVLNSIAAFVFSIIGTP